MVDEAEGRGLLSTGQKAHQPIDHAPSDTSRDPHVAVDNPYKIALGLAVCPADVSDFWIGPEVGAVKAGKQRVVLLYEETDMVCGRKVVDNLFQDGIGGIILGGHTEADVQVGGRVGLAESRSQAGIEFRLEAFDRADDGDVGELILG